MSGALLLLGVFDGASQSVSAIDFRYRQRFRHLICQHWINDCCFDLDLPTDDPIYLQCLEGAASIIDAMGLSGDPTVLVRKVPVDQSIGTNKTSDWPVIILAPWRDPILPDAGPIQRDDVVYGVMCLLVDRDNREGTIRANLDRILGWRETIRRHFHLPGSTSAASDMVESITPLINITVEPMDATLREAWAQGLYGSAMLLKFTSRETRGAN